MLGPGLVPRPQPGPTARVQGGDHRPLPAGLEARGVDTGGWWTVGSASASSPSPPPSPGRRPSGTRTSWPGGTAAAAPGARGSSEHPPGARAYRGASRHLGRRRGLAYVPLARHLVARRRVDLPGPRALDAGAGTGAASEATAELGARVVPRTSSRTCSGAPAAGARRRRPTSPGCRSGGGVRRGGGRVRAQPHPRHRAALSELAGSPGRAAPSWPRFRQPRRGQRRRWTAGRWTSGSSRRAGTPTYASAPTRSARSTDASAAEARD